MDIHLLEANLFTDCTQILLMLMGLQIDHSIWKGCSFGHIIILFKTETILLCLCNFIHRCAMNMTWPLAVTSRYNGLDIVT